LLLTPSSNSPTRKSGSSAFVKNLPIYPAALTKWATLDEPLSLPAATTTTLVAGLYYLGWIVLKTELANSKGTIGGLLHGGIIPVPDSGEGRHGDIAPGQRHGKLFKLSRACKWAGSIA
jgi:hypothetical protein